MAQRKGRRKKVNFNPNQEFISNAIENFLKKGGRITKIYDDGFGHFINQYRSDSAIGMEALPGEFIL